MKGEAREPRPETSRGLANAGALVNSFIFASRARTLVRLFEGSVPDLAQAMVPFVLAGSPPARLHHLDDEIPTLDFSRAVLERVPGSLGFSPSQSAAGPASALRRGSSASWTGGYEPPARRRALQPPSDDGQPGRRDR